LKKLYNPDGFNLGMNLGQAAGAGIREHFHLHVVPRWIGDANFMGITAETRVLPEALSTTYNRIKAEL
jgi:ATP adenylyltransferase